MQAASNLENLKMQSPVKQPTFTSKPIESSEQKTSQPDQWDDTIAKPIEGLPRLARQDDAVADAENSVAPTIKPDEADEPLLRENPNRFVLFPIKYHEVRVFSRDASETPTHASINMQCTPMPSNLSYID